MNICTEQAQARAQREARNADAIRVLREEETRRSDEEKWLFRGSTRLEADKRLKSKMFLSMGNQGQRCIFQKYPNSKTVDITFAELWKMTTDAFFREPNVLNRRFILFGRKQGDTEGMVL